MVRELARIVAAAVVVACTASDDGVAQRPTPDSGVVALTHVNVVTMAAPVVLPEHTVIIGGGVIQAVGPTARIRIPENAAVVDARGKYLVPGLIDSHVHVRAASELAAYLRYGVTTVLNLRGSAELLELRDRVREGTLGGPRIYTAGPLVDGAPPIWQGSGTRVVETPQDAANVVEEHRRAGYDVIKVYNNLSPAVLEVVVREAHRNGLAVVGHLPRRPERRHGLRAALEAGIDLIAHGEEIFFTHFGGAPDSLLRAGGYVRPSDAELRTVAELIDREGVAVIPNLSFIAMTARLLDSLETVLSDPEFARLDPDVQEMWRAQNPTRRSDLEAFAARETVKRQLVRRLVAALHAEGVPLLAGTDASAPGLFPGASLHLELRELVEAGLSPYDALATATRAPGVFLARHLDDAPLLGVVQVGAAADLILLDGNPLDEVRHAMTPAAVMVRGRWVVP